MTVIKYTSKPTFRNVLGQFSNAEKGFREDRRDIMRNMARRFKDMAQDEAPRRTGKFAKGIRFRTFTDGDNIGFTASVPMPLGRWIIAGTRPHVITPKGPGYPLRFYWEKMGRWVAFYRVNHPGTKPNPFMRRAYDKWKVDARKEQNRISTRFGVEWKRGL